MLVMLLAMLAPLTKSLDIWLTSALQVGLYCVCWEMNAAKSDWFL